MLLAIIITGAVFVIAVLFLLGMECLLDDHY